MSNSILENLILNVVEESIPKGDVYPCIYNIYAVSESSIDIFLVPTTSYKFAQNWPKQKVYVTVESILKTLQG